MKAVAVSKSVPLFAPRLTPFAAIDWPKVMETHEFKFIGLCNDPERRSCYGRPFIEDAKAAPYQGLPFVSGFNTESERYLNDLLHELRLAELLPERVAKLLPEPQRAFLAQWVPVDLPAEFRGMYANMTLIERQQLYLRDLIQGTRQSIYHQRLNAAEAVHQTIGLRRRQEESDARWAAVDANREQARQVRRQLQREAGHTLTFTQPVEQLDLFTSQAA